MAMRFQVKNTTAGQPSWWLISSNGQTVAWVGETFDSTTNHPCPGKPVRDQRPWRSGRVHGHASTIQLATASASGPSRSARLARTHDCTETSCSTESAGYR